MNPAVLGALVDVGSRLVDRIFPDKRAMARERAEAERQVREWALDAEQFVVNKLMESDALQVEVNKIEAASNDKFKSRWRPATGWVCVSGYAYQFLAWPLLTWASDVFQFPTPPQLDITELSVMLGGLLGLGVYRTYEKKNGVA